MYDFKYTQYTKLFIENRIYICIVKAPNNLLYRSITNPCLL